MVISSVWYIAFSVSRWLFLDLFSSCSLQCKFEELDSDELSAQVTKYSKIVMQLEKGLPPNNVVSRLKDHVDSMREKVYLRTSEQNTLIAWDFISISPDLIVFYKIDDRRISISQ